MKLLDIMKKYDRCLVRESAKLAKIYNMILKESETEESLDEETCPDCGNDPCICDKNENEQKEKECDECGTADLIPEEDFIKSNNENDECEDGECPIPESEFFAEAEKECKDAECNEDDEDDSSKKAEKPAVNKEDGDFMSAAEFFAEAEKECDESEDDIVDESEKDADESEKETDEAEKELDEEIEITPDAPMIDAKELLPETEEKKLEESLKSYRRKNHHLFNA